MHLTYWSGTKAEVWSWWRGNSEKLLHQVLKGKTGTAGYESSLSQLQSALLMSHTGETHKIPTEFPWDRFHSELHSILWVAFFLISCSFYFKYPLEHSTQSWLFFFFSPTVVIKANLLYACKRVQMHKLEIKIYMLCNYAITLARFVGKEK